MPNDGYEILNGRLITGSVITSAGGVEVCRFTIPEDVDMRINTLCLIQNQADASDGYSYWIDALVTRYDNGDVSIINYGSVYNATGTLTEVLIGLSSDGYDIVFAATNAGINNFRLSTFVNIYQIENTGITEDTSYPMGITITEPTSESEPWVTDIEFAAYGTILSGEHVVSFSGGLVDGTAQSFIQTDNTWAGDGFAGSSAGMFDLEVSVTYDNAEVRTATVSVELIAPV